MRVTENKDGAIEREILTAMIVNAEVCGRIASLYTDELFASPWAKHIASMTVRYFRKHNKSPNRHIEGLFRRWSESRQRDTSTVGLVEQYLSTLNNEYERATEINASHVIDAAGEFFTKTSLDRLRQKIEDALADGQIAEAQALLDTHKRIELGVGAGINLATDDALQDSIFNEQSDPLIKYKGALGNFYGGMMERDSFIAFEGPDKSGKSFYLQDVAYHAMMQRKRVAHFVVGDLSEKQITKRYYTRMAKRPFISSDGNWPVKIKWPTYLSPPGNSEDSASVDTEERVFEVPLTSEQVTEARQKFHEKLDTYLRISVHASESINVARINAILDGWNNAYGWNADVVVIDYADVLGDPPGGAKDERDKINKNWVAMVAMRQERHCLVVTASQTDASAYDQRLINRRNFSGDKRKLAHVSGLIGINVTGEEKEKGLYRLNWIVRRDGEYSWRKVCYVAGCLALASPCVLSSF